MRNSALYRWLTAEPDPDVIVIDLRETWTVGPFLVILDWILERLIDAAADSRAVAVAQRGMTATRAAPLRVMGLVTALVGVAVAASGLIGGISTPRLGGGIALAIGGLTAMQDGRDWATLRETRPVALTIAALEPPDTPETTADDEPDDQPHPTTCTRSTSAHTDDADANTLSGRSSDTEEQSDPDNS